MIQLTMTGEYAVRAMMHLSGYPYGTVVQITDVSDRWQIPENFLRKIVPHLTRAGLIRSQRGSGGGIQLGRPAEEMNLLEVIQAVEGEIFLNKCLIAPGTCSMDAGCSVHTVWCEAQQSVKEILTRSSLAALAAAARPAPVPSVRTLA
jgi:Rrf2 family transcriptional regulator, iron-sulfur cluster assembly transcription factor